MAREEQQRAQKFLAEFKKLEHLLSRLASTESKRVSISENLKIVSKKNAFIRRNEKQINLFRDLRNFLAHEDHGSYGHQHLAIPRQELIDDLSKIVDRLENPILTVDHYNQKIHEFTPENTISDVLNELHKHSYSQAFVREEGEIKLLSANTILRWLSSNKEIGLVELNEPVKEILRHVEFQDEFLIKNTRITVDETLDLFLGKKWPHLVAVVITDNGKASGKVLGMITSSDLAELSKIDSDG